MPHSAKPPQFHVRGTVGGAGFALPFFRKRAAFYIDGLNLYHAVLGFKEPHLKWLNLKLLAQNLVPNSEVVKRVVWCSAIRTTNRAQAKRHALYQKALEAVGVETRMGHFITSIDGCNSCGHRWVMSIEKQSDVNLALSIAADAEDNLFDICYLVTGDGDQAATARYLKERFPKKKIVLVAPPRRMPNKHISKYCDGVIQISQDHIEASLFGVAVSPKTWPWQKPSLIMRPSLYEPPQPRVKKHLTLVVNK